MSLPNEPYSRIERYLARLAGQDVDIPDKPITRIECYLDYLVNNGGGSPASSAGGHNAVFRGQSLGSSFTDAQKAAISGGTFEGLFVGDYWDMSWNASPVHFRIAGFDLLWGAGAVPMSRHHVVLVPDECLGSSIYSDTEFAEGYSGSILKSYITTDIIPGLETLFGTLVPYNMRVATGATNTDWIESKADVLSSISLFGEYGSTNYYTSLSNSLFIMFPLFNMAPWLVRSPGYNYWIQEVITNTTGTIISAEGRKLINLLTNSRAVRPFFLIGGTT